MYVEISTTITPSDLSLLEQLYLTSFPAEERRPWQSIISPTKPNGPILYSILADGKIVGMATLWIFDDFAYIEHLAIKPDFRSYGIGSRVIGLIRELVGKHELVVEIEPPVADRPETVKRLNFYRRQGFEVIDPDYVQPPYAPGLDEVRLHLMSTAPMSPYKIGRTLHSEVYGR